jgi:hypothetical protein
MARRFREKEGLKRDKVTSGDGVTLHLVETGNPGEQPILFSHGFSQRWLARSRQMSSDVADDYPLVAMDAGHACLWDDATTFNRCLQEFAENLQTSPAIWNLACHGQASREINNFAGATP